MKIGVIGTGYVGLVQGTILADFGLNVTCMDMDEEKIQMLREGEIPIYEPGLLELVKKNVKAGRLTFTTAMKSTVENSDVIFIAVGTPPNQDGSADLRFVLSVAESIGQYINDYKVIVDKSTVPVGTGKKVKAMIKDKIEERGVEIDFDVVSNPEFLREGKAVKDCQIPDRVVIGVESEKAKGMMKKVYDVLYINQTPFVFTNVETAEMIKYASNSFLAVKISFINEMALICEKAGANVQEVARAMGMDGRISPKFLHAGPGYGGSCFPKDTKAIVNIANEYDEDFYVVKAAIDANIKQKRKMVSKIINEMGDVKGKKIGTLGLSFKPETDDMRDAPSIEIIKGLVEAGAEIRAFCPEGIPEAKWRLKDEREMITFCKNSYEVAEGSDAIVLITEWHQFRGMDLTKIKENMKDNYFFDLRNVFAKNAEVNKLFKYYGVGIG